MLTYFVHGHQPEGEIWRPADKSGTNRALGFDPCSTHRGGSPEGAGSHVQDVQSWPCHRSGSGGRISGDHLPGGGVDVGSLLRYCLENEIDHCPFMSATIDGSGDEADEVAPVISPEEYISGMNDVCDFEDI